MDKSDDRILQDVLRELAANGRVKPTEVGVTVRAGVVTLVGEVDAWDKSGAAVEAAHSVLGVHDVVNELDVIAPDSGRVSDRTIAIAVREVLREWLGARADAVTSTVTDGVVTLCGRVDDPRCLQEADSIIRDLRGVRDVIDCARVRAAVTVDEVRAAIEAKLKEHCVHEAESLDLRVVDGAVDVIGRVESQDEKERVLDAVRSMPGVRLRTERLVVVAAIDRPPAL